jgi:hypothetical protein
MTLTRQQAPIFDKVKPFPWMLSDDISYPALTIMQVIDRELMWASGSRKLHNNISTRSLVPFKVKRNFWGRITPDLA